MVGCSQLRSLMAGSELAPFASLCGRLLARAISAARNVHGARVPLLCLSVDSQEVDSGSGRPLQAGCAAFTQQHAELSLYAGPVVTLSDTVCCFPPDLQAITSTFLGLPAAVFSATLTGSFVIKTTSQVRLQALGCSCAVSHVSANTQLQEDERIRCYSVTCLPATGKVQACLLPEQVKDGQFEGSEFVLHLKPLGAETCPVSAVYAAASFLTSGTPGAGRADVLHAAQTLLEQYSVLQPCLNLLLRAVSADGEQVSLAATGPQLCPALA